MLTNDENTLPTHIAKIPNGAEAIRKNITVNCFTTSNFKNKSERPRAFRRFKFKMCTCHHIRAKQSTCKYTTQGNHFSVTKIKTRGLAQTTNPIIIGKIT